MEQNNQKKGKRLIYWSIIFVIGAIITALPLKLADDNCFFGYLAICPFTPFSTLIMLAIASYFLMMRKKLNISK